MKHKTLRELPAGCLPFLVLCLLMTGFHLCYAYVPQDEIFYGGILQNGSLQSLLAMLQEHYHTWSARLLVESLFCVFSALPVWVWRLLNPVMIALLGWLVAYAFRLEKDLAAAGMICVLLYLYQWDYLRDAGWIVTTIAYLWTAVLALAGLFCLFRLLRGETVSPWMWAGSSLCLLVGVNMEQTDLMCLLILGGSLLYLGCRKIRIPPMLWAQFALVVGMLVFSLTAPGNALRSEYDQFAFYPNYPMLSLLQKIEIGISGAVTANVFGRDSVFFLFAALTTLAVWEKNAVLPARLLSVLPPLFLLPFSIFQYELGPSFPLIGFFTTAYSPAGMLNLTNAGNPIAYLPLVCSYGVFALCLLNLWAAFGPSLQNAKILALVLLGGISQSAMGFLPSVAVSGRRTGFFFSVCLIAACALIWQTLREKAPPRRLPRAVFYLAAAVLCGIQVIYLSEMCAF